MENSARKVKIVKQKKNKNKKNISKSNFFFIEISRRKHKKNHTTNIKIGVWIPLKSLTQTHFCASPKARTSMVFNGLRQEIIVCFVDIGENC